MIVINKPVQIEIRSGIKFKSSGCGKYMVCEYNEMFSLVRLDTESKDNIGTFMFKDVSKDEAEKRILDYIKLFDFELMEE